MRTRSLLTALAIMTLLPLGVAAEEAFNYSYFDMTYLNNGMDGTVTTINDRDRIDVNVGEGDGMGVRMSLAVNTNLHVFAGYSGSNMDVNATQTMSYPTLGEMRSAFLTTPGAANWDGFCDLTGDGMVNFLDLKVLKEASGDTRIASHAAVDGDLTDWRIGVGYNKLLATKVSGYAQVFWDDRNLDLGNALFMGERKDFGANDNGFGASVGLRGKVTDRFELTGHATYTPVGDINMLAETDADMLRSDTLFGIGSEFWFTDAFSIAAEVEGDGDVRAWLIAARFQFRS